LAQAILALTSLPGGEVVGAIFGLQMDFHQGMRQMHLQLHQDMAQLRREAAERRHMMQQQLQGRQIGEAVRMRREVWAQQEAHLRAMEQLRPHMRSMVGHVQQDEAASPSAQGSRSNGLLNSMESVGMVWGDGDVHGNAVSASVQNGCVIVNGQPVARVPQGGPVSLQTVNGEVRVNGQRVWPRPDAADTPAPQVGDTAAGPPQGRRQPTRESLERARLRALSHSREGACGADLAEPCPICLQEVRTGDRIRTLPCFHMLHHGCAEALFASPQQVRGRGRLRVLCPTCRGEVGGD